VWTENPSDTTLLWTKWLGNQWEPQRGVSRNALGVWSRLRPDLAFDEQRRAWLVWHNGYENNNRDIAACYWDDSRWSSEQQVCQPDSSDVDFAPKANCGGGQVWCVWYGRPTRVSPNSVYASRWNDDIGQWEGETRVSPGDGNSHWWCDLAADARGRPHVVWVTHPLYLVNYSYFDRGQWQGPFPVNDTTLVKAAPWGDPRIAMDRDGVMHLSFTGARVGAMHRDIFYTRNDGSGWIPCQMVTRDSLYDEWCSDIAAESRANVWMTWDRQNEGPDQFRVYAAHFDGRLWSSEQRLDDTSSYYDVFPAVCLDSSGNPWVFWTGIPAGQASDDVFFNRVVNTDLAEAQPASVFRLARLRCATLQNGSSTAVTFDLIAASQVRVALYNEAGRCMAVLADRHMPRGTHTVRCREFLASGVYLCRLQAGGQSDLSRVVLLGR
jgi:hypothetical protein